MDVREETLPLKLTEYNNHQTIVDLEDFRDPQRPWNSKNIKCFKNVQ